MAAPALTVRAKMLSAVMSPCADRLRPWLVRLRVQRIIAGELPEDRRELSILVHSPSRDFQATDPIGRTFVITFRDPLTNPYAGAIEVGPDSYSADSGADNKS